MNSKQTNRQQRPAIDQRKKWNEQGPVNHILQGQWTDASHTQSDPFREERLLRNILHKIRFKHHWTFEKKFYQYSIAATIALCIGLTILLIHQIQRPASLIYVLNTGHQSVDSVLLADGTKVLLSAGSRLVYPENFSGDTREITLSGQAFFKVAPDTKHPFIVKTKTMDINVLGTSFEVFSFDADKKAEAVLLNGKVKVKLNTKVDGQQQTYALNPNEKLSYKENGEVEITTVNADAYSSWRNKGRLSFKNETLEMIIDRLEKWYGQRIDCEKELAQNYRFTFTLYGESLEMVLNYLTHSAPLDCKIVSNGHYIIQQKRKYQQ